MAKAKTEDSVNLIDIFSDFTEEKRIDRATLINVLEESIRSVIQKMYGSDENYNVVINPNKGDFEIWRSRVVVPDGEVEDENLQDSSFRSKKNRG